MTDTKERKLRKIPVPLPDDGYTDTPAFMQLAENCGRGDGEAMWEMSQYFQRMHDATGHPFFLPAADFWRYMAFLSCERNAAVWLFTRLLEMPDAPLSAPLDESRSGERIDGGIYRCLGFLHFERGVQYDVYPTGNLGVTFVCAYPHRNGTFEASQFAYTYLDEYLNPLPVESIYFHPLKRPNKDTLAEYMLPVLSKAVVSAFKRNRKQRRFNTYICIR